MTWYDPFYPLGGRNLGGHRGASQALYGGATQQPGTGAGGAATLPATPEPPKRKPIEDAGIRAGEIIGHRGWRIKNGLLVSIFKSEHVWRPDEPMRGDVSGEYGVHAFNNPYLVATYVAETKAYAQSMHQVYMQAALRPGGIINIPEIEFGGIFAFGTVAMWGEVIEHSRGYRAEFAKVASIDWIEGGDADTRECVLIALRIRYGVG